MKNLGEFITRGTAIGEKTIDLASEVAGLLTLVKDTVFEPEPVEKPKVNFYSRPEQLDALGWNSLVHDNFGRKYQKTRDLNQKPVWVEIFDGVRSGVYYTSAELFETYRVLKSDDA